MNTKVLANVGLAFSLVFPVALVLRIRGVLPGANPETPWGAVVIALLFIAAMIGVVLGYRSSPSKTYASSFSIVFGVASLMILGLLMFVAIGLRDFGPT